MTEPRRAGAQIITYLPLPLFLLYPALDLAQVCNIYTYAIRVQNIQTNVRLVVRCYIPAKIEVEILLQVCDSRNNRSTIKSVLRYTSMP